MIEWFDVIAGGYHNILAVILMMLGFYSVIASPNLIKKLIGVAIFQTSVLLIYISAAYVSDARFPILKDGVEQYVNPLPHVLMLTAIVVGIATLSVGLALVVRIKEAYGSIDEDDILAMEREMTASLAKQDQKKWGKDSPKPVRKKRIFKAKHVINHVDYRMDVPNKTTKAKPSADKASAKKNAKKAGK